MATRDDLVAFFGTDGSVFKTILQFQSLTDARDNMKPTKAWIVITTTMVYVVGRELHLANGEKEEEDDGFSAPAMDILFEDVVESIEKLVVYAPQEEAMVAGAADPLFAMHTFGQSKYFRVTDSEGGADDSSSPVHELIHAIGTLPGVELLQKDITDVTEEAAEALRSKSSNAMMSSPGPRFDAYSEEPPAPAGSPPSGVLSVSTATPSVSNMGSRLPSVAPGPSIGRDGRHHPMVSIESQLDNERERLRAVHQQAVSGTLLEILTEEATARRDLYEEESSKRCNTYAVFHSAVVSILTRQHSQELSDLRNVLCNATELPETMAASTSPARVHAEGSTAAAGAELSMPTPQSVGFEAPTEAGKAVAEEFEKATRTRLGKFITTTQRQLTDRRRNLEADVAQRAYVQAEAHWVKERQELEDRIMIMQRQLTQASATSTFLSQQLQDLRDREQTVLDKARKRENILQDEVALLRKESTARLTSPPPAGAPADHVIQSSPGIALDADEELGHGMAAPHQVSNTQPFNYFGS